MDYNNAAAQVLDYIHAVYGVDLGNFQPDDEEDYEVAYEGIGRVALHAAENPDWDPDWHWLTWKDQLPNQ